MSIPRASGILLHPTSLPGRFGIGDLGAAAYEFVDFLEETGQGLWQILPLGPTGYGDSPYSCLSAFAGNPLLISLEALVADGLLDQSDLDNASEFSPSPPYPIDYGRVIEFKGAMLKKAHANFIGNASDQAKDEYLAFIGQAGWWLEDYATYRAIKDAHDGREWTKWDSYLRDREDSAMHYFRENHAVEVSAQKFYQFLFFEQVKRAFDGGDLPIIAEDLGYITHEVIALRDRFELPGMQVLQFAFGTDPQADAYKPYNYVKNSVVYTGTHDNDTTVGWFTGEGAGLSTRSHDEVTGERDLALKYLGTDGREINWDFIRLALSSVADTAIIPLQDVLGLGSEARMNVPARESGNWSWRYTADQLTPEVRRRLAEMTEVYGRNRARMWDRF